MVFGGKLLVRFVTQVSGVSHNFISKSCTKVIDSTLLRLLSPIMFDSFFCFSSAGFLVDHGQCGIGVESDQAETEFTTHYRHSATVFD